MKAFIVLFSALAIAASASADVLTMKDGRRFEGTIVSDQAEATSIDTVVSGIRVTLRLAKSEIASHERKAVPAGFYDPPAAEPRVSDPTKVTDRGSLYLEVPVKGEFGKDVLADGIRAALRYARAHRIGHVVFNIDSTGGDLDEAAEIYQLLKSQYGDLRLHAIIHNCQGDAIAIPAVCDTVNLLPGAKVGGLGRKIADISQKLAKEDEDVIRRQIANELEAAARQRGRSGLVVRALVDPRETITAWRDEKGEPRFAAEAPADVPADRIVIKDGPDALLMLTYEQAVALGMPPFKGEAKDLGELLGISQWQSESGYGATAMSQAVAAHEKRKAAASSVFETKVKNNVARRETAQRSIEHNLKQAAEWAPTKESYATYKNYATRWNWGWGRGYWNYGDHNDGVETNRLTAESRRKWRDRTDASMYYLVEARSAMKTMQRLDAEAAKLGLDTTYKPGELDDLIKDIEVKVTYLNNHRIKTTE